MLSASQTKAFAGRPKNPNRLKGTRESEEEEEEEEEGTFRKGFENPRKRSEPFQREPFGADYRESEKTSEPLERDRRNLRKKI